MCPSALWGKEKGMQRGLIGRGGREGKADEGRRERPMKSFTENGVVIQASPEKSQCFLLFLEETFCWPVPPRPPAHLTRLL